MNNKRKIKKIVISAAYGMGNLGDEAICETIVNDLFSINKDIEILIFVFDVDRFLKAHPSFRNNKKIIISKIVYSKKDLFNLINIVSILKNILSIKFCDIFIWGGGGIVRNRTNWLKIYMLPLKTANFFKKNIFIWSIGVNNITDPEVVKLIGRLRGANFISVRDKESRDSLAKILNNKEIYIISDPAYHFMSLEKNFVKKEEFSIGLNFAFWKANLSNDSDVEKFIDSLSIALNNFSNKHKCVFYYLPTVPTKDNVFFMRLKKKLSPSINVVYPNIDTPKEYAEFLSNMDLFVCSRLHSVILASGINNLAIIPIVYDEKVLNLSRKVEGNFFLIKEIIEKPDSFLNRMEDCFNDPERYLLNFDEIRYNSLEVKKYLSAYVV